MSPDGSAKAPLPEERLLKLIRGKQRAASPVAASPAAPAKAVLMPSRQWQSGRGQSTWVGWVAGILGLIVAGEVGLIVFYVMRPLPVIEAPVIVRSGPVTGVTPPRPNPTPPLARHAAKPLFAEPIVVRPKPPAPNVSKGEVNQLAARLSLLGIIDGDPPQAIIEDGQTNKSHFVIEGQMVVEGATVQEIHDDRVVLEYFGELIMLNL